MRRSAVGAALLLASLASLSPVRQVRADTPPSVSESDGPASAELRQIVTADQADRQGDWTKLSEAERKAVGVRDDARLARVRELLKADKVRTAGDFDSAALVFQHGLTTDDYLVAHELSFVALLKKLRAGQRSINNLTVLAEDRFLRSLDRPQRFGSQGVWKPGPDGSMIQPVAEEGPYAVTDTLRADLFIAPLEASRKKGPMATMDHFEALGKRIQERSDPKWIAAQTGRKESVELARLGETKPQEQDVKRVLELYQADLLATPDDYYRAGLLLQRSVKGQTATAVDRLLLAHELATVAALRGQTEAPRLWAETWDRYLLAIGQKQRYGVVQTKRGQKTVYSGGIADSASDSVRRALGVAPLAKDFSVEPVPDSSGR